MADIRSSTQNEFNFDLIVLGAGPAGLSCARSSAKLGAKVACFECLDASQSHGIKDCVVDQARKLFFESGLVREYLQDSAAYSYNIVAPDAIDWKKYVEVMKKQIADFEQCIKAELKTLKIEFFNTFGYFKDKNTIGYMVEQNVEETVTAKFILIAASGHPILPDVPGVELGITRHNILNLNKPPGNTLVVGSTHHCLETASFLRLLNFNVTVIAEAAILPRLDPQMIDIVLEAMERRGITLLRSHYVYNIEKSNQTGRVSVDYNAAAQNQLKNNVYDTLIWSIGAEVELSKFKCENIAIDLKENKVIVDKHDQTSVSNIFAIGDICSTSRGFTSVTNLRGHFLAKRLFAGSTNIMAYNDFAAAIFTTAEYSFLGMTEIEALEQFGVENVEVYHGYFRPTEYYMPKRSTSHCYTKVITLLDGDEPVLGMHYIGPYAGEVIQGFAVAMAGGKLTAKIVFHTIHIHPTVAATFVDLTITKRSELDPNPGLPCS